MLKAVYTALMRNVPMLVLCWFTGLPTLTIAAPNIVLILMDDMNYSEELYMPLFQEKVAALGMQFTQSYTVSPFCCPARASILRGQYVHNHGVYGNGGSDGGFNQFHDAGLESETIATWMQSLGYRTGLVGKYLNGYGITRGLETYVPPGWDDWFALVRQPYYNVTLVENGVSVVYSATEYQTDLLADKAKSFVEKFNSDPRPFFLYFAPSAPHSPWTPAARHKGAYAGLTAPRTISFNEADVTDKPSYVKDLPLMTTADISKVDSSFPTRMESLLAVDEAIDGLISMLTQIGQLDNTYIFFTSDNGWQQGEHRMFDTKGVPYEESIRMPLAVKGPGIAAAALRSELVANIDLAPTFIEIAGGTLPAIADGRSLLPILNNQQPLQWRKRVMVEGLSESQERIPQYRSMRTLRYSFSDYYNLGEKEMYDLTLDPYELSNLYGKVSTSLQSRLTSDLGALQTCAGATCRVVDQ